MQPPCAMLAPSTRSAYNVCWRKEACQGAKKVALLLTQLDGIRVEHNQVKAQRWLDCPRIPAAPPPPPACLQQAKEYCREVVRVLRTLKERRDMGLNEVRLTVAIEDPRARERRLMGMENDSGVSRDEMAAALTEVAEGKVPSDRIALRELYREMIQWPFLDRDAPTSDTGEARGERRKGGRAGALGHARQNGLSPAAQVGNAHRGRYFWRREKGIGGVGEEAQWTVLGVRQECLCCQASLGIGTHHICCSWGQPFRLWQSVC